MRHLKLACEEHARRKHHPGAAWLVRRWLPAPRWIASAVTISLFAISIAATAGRSLPLPWRPGPGAA